MEAGTYSNIYGTHVCIGEGEAYSRMLIRSRHFLKFVWYSRMFRGGGRIFEEAYSKRALIQIFMALMYVEGSGKHIR